MKSCKGNEDSLEAMINIRDSALQMKEAILKGDLDKVVELLNLAGVERSSKVVSSEYIDNIYETARKAGTGEYLELEVVVLCFYAKPEARMDVIRALNRFSGVTYNCQFTERGAESWTT